MHDGGGRSSLGIAALSRARLARATITIERSRTVEIRVLGPVEIVAEEQPVPLPALKQRQLLAALVVRAGEARSADLLIDALWGASRPPRRQSCSRRTSRSCARRCRLRPNPHTRGGYALELEDECSMPPASSGCSRREGGPARAGNPALAASMLRRALALWRGQAYGDFAYEGFARGEAERLEELRLSRSRSGSRRSSRSAATPSSCRAAQPRRRPPAPGAPAGAGDARALPLRAAVRGARALHRYPRPSAGRAGTRAGAELRELQRRILQHDPGSPPPPQAPTASATCPRRRTGSSAARASSGAARLLLRDEVRLLVLTGAGGSGKTRLALEAARESAAAFANGARLRRARADARRLDSS